MANIALQTNVKQLSIVQSIEQHTAPALEDITAGAPVRLDPAAGTFRNGNGTTSTEADIYGIATKTVKAGYPVTAIRKGVLDGFVLTGNYSSRVFVSDTDGRLADAAGTVSREMGRVIGGHAQTLGNSPDKLLLVDVQ